MEIKGNQCLSNVLFSICICFSYYIDRGNIYHQVRGLGHASTHSQSPGDECKCSENSSFFISIFHHLFVSCNGKEILLCPIICLPFNLSETYPRIFSLVLLVVCIFFAIYPDEGKAIGHVRTMWWLFFSLAFT